MKSPSATKIDVNLEATFAEADEVIAQSQRLTDQVRVTATEAALETDIFAKPKAFAQPDPDPETAPPKRRWHTHSSKVE
jgi:hypothetical protein